MIRSVSAIAAIGMVGLLAVTPEPAEAQRNETFLYVYGDDDCPTSNGEEIVVCVRLDESERYRIPQQLRETRDQPADSAWASRARAIE